jgi:hypothetical protein
MTTTSDPTRGAWPGDWRRPSPRPELRVSDAERNEVAQILSQHFADGRLDQVEFDERLGLAMNAKTRSDLAPLLSDLPMPDAEDHLPIDPGPKRRRFVRLAFIVVAVLVLANAATALVHPHLPWVLFGIVALLVLRHRRHVHYRGGSAAQR